MSRRTKDRTAAGGPERTGRMAEFWMLVFAAVVVTSALVIVELNQNRTLSWEDAGMTRACPTVWSLPVRDC